MTAYGSPALKKRLPRDLVRYFAKPIDVEILAKAILLTIERKIPRGAVRGISVVNFLNMIRMEKKTCLFEIRKGEDASGLLFFDKGVLFDASFGDLKGEEAAAALITKDRAEIRFRYFPDQKVPRNIHTDVKELIQKVMETEEEVTEDEWDDIISELI